MSQSIRRALARSHEIPLLLSAVALLLLALGCGTGSGQLISELGMSSTVVSPTGKGDTPPLSVTYTLSAPATVSAYLVGSGGERYSLRSDEYRPVAGLYQLSFIGSYSPKPDGPERRVLPPGSYEFVVEARDGAGNQRKSTARVEVRDSDTLFPAVETLTLFPDVISPDFDGIDDMAKITYRTTKDATVSLALISESGKRYLLEREEGKPPGEHSTTWDGQVGNQLLPSGSYRFLVEAEDPAGNVAVAERPFRLESSNVPDAHLLAVNMDPERVLLGGLVKVEMRVKNTGNTVLRSHGPDPGFVYDSQEGFSTIEDGAFRDEKGYWRLGVDWAGGPGAAGSKYPYRWGFGKDLQPGEEVTVVGYIRINHRYPQIWLHAGLIQEQVRYWDNEVGRTVIEIGF